MKQRGRMAVRYQKRKVYSYQGNDFTPILGLQVAFLRGVTILVQWIHEHVPEFSLCSATISCLPTRTRSRVREPTFSVFLGLIGYVVKVYLVSVSNGLHWCLRLRENEIVKEDFSDEDFYFHLLTTLRKVGYNFLECFWVLKADRNGCMKFRSQDQLNFELC